MIIMAKQDTTKIQRVTKRYPITGDDPNTPGNIKKKKQLDSMRKSGWNSDVNSVKRVPGTDSISVGFYKKGGKTVPKTPKKKS